MKYIVNESCIGCGFCTGVCPKVFSMGDDFTAKAIPGEVPEDALDAAEQAMDGCPAGAIEEA